MKYGKLVEPQVGTLASKRLYPGGDICARLCQEFARFWVGKNVAFLTSKASHTRYIYFFSSVCSYVSNNTISSMKIGNTHCVRLKTRSGIVRPHHAASDLCSHYSLNSLVQTKTAVSAWLAGTGCRQENQVLVVCGWPMVTTNGAGPYSVHTWRNVSRYTLAQTSISNQPP